jgi:hypothetical protein
MRKSFFKDVEITGANSRFLRAAGFEAFELLLIETHKLACSVRMKPIRAGRETRIRDWFQEVRP